jgi:hypothetical protein
MSDLMVLLSTLGGIVLFGALGIIVGPLVGALFITIWDLYGAAFKDILPKPDIVPSILPGPPLVPQNPWRAPWGGSVTPEETPFPSSSRSSEHEGRSAYPDNLVPRVPHRVEPRSEPNNARPDRDSDESAPPSETTLR